MKQDPRLIISNACDAKPKKDAVVNGINLSELVDLFESLDYDCETNSELRGISGMRHQFDIVARKGQEIIVIDIVSYRSSLLDTCASDDESAEQILTSAVQMRAKGWDSQVYQSIIIHLCSSGMEAERDLSYAGEPLAKILRQINIELIRTPDMRNGLEQLTNVLRTVEGHQVV